MKRYNFLTWWLDLDPKPLVYKIWKMTVTPVMFIAWVMFVAVYPDRYWDFSLYAVLPVAIVDFVWEIINWRRYLARTKADGGEDQEG